MITVKLIAHTNCHPLDLASFAAKTCYAGEEPKFGERMDVEKRLFNVGHHTTLEHFYLTFFIEGIAVSGITFGLHLARNQFYNSDQRSGRFCIDMFENPDYGAMEKYILSLWGDTIDFHKISAAINFVKQGIAVYQENLSKAVAVAEKFIRAERPKANEKYVIDNAKKFAQEQMRVFISTIFPTADCYTIDLVSLAANYKAAWNPQMRYVTQLMVDAVLAKWPEISFMFERGNLGDYGLTKESLNWNWGITHEPETFLKNREPIQFTVPKISDIHPIDALFFHPKFMDGSLGNISEKIHISVATMGQDHRHRTVDQGRVEFSGSFYLPPVPAELGLDREAEEIKKTWVDLLGILPPSLFEALSPYGATVSYTKHVNLNALIHEQQKRLCWCTQEEIFNLNRQLRDWMMQEKGNWTGYIGDVDSIFSPPCVRAGTCAEGTRYCGRDMGKSPFIKRKI